MPHLVDTSRRWTLEEVERLIENAPEYGPRYELVDGELLVSAAPRYAHQTVLEELRGLLGPFVRAHRLGRLLASPGDLRLVPGTITQPDLFLVPAGERRPREWRDVTRLLLAVEVVSPSTARYDRGTKRRYYQRAGVPEYWVVHPDARLVERWRPGDDRPEVLGETLAWTPRAGPSPW